MDTLDYTKLDRELDRVKSHLFMGNNAGFLGPLMCSLNFVWTDKIETCETDGVEIRWNPTDFLGCTFAGRVSSLLHELAHVYRLHMARQGNRCPDVWNIACDICINRDLLQMGYKLEWAQQGVGPHPEIPFTLEEEIYDYLQKNGGNENQAHQHACGGMVVGTQATIQGMINNVIKATHTAHINKQAGSIPGGVELIIEKFLKPKIPWETVLYLWFNDLLEDDYTWKKRNRRYEDMYLPSRVTEEGRLEHLAYYFDVSGSVSDHMVTRFNSEVKYIKDTYNPVKLTLVLFDTKIQSIFEYNEEDQFGKLKVVGRGGTDLSPIREHMMDAKPTAAIVFSDLYCAEMELGPQCPIIWITVNNPHAHVRMGQLVHIMEKE
jgi:predicted metal-dependent peptidase